jgi:transposase
MHPKNIEKMKAQELRKKGTSLKKIAKVLHVSSSSVHLWCKDLKEHKLLVETYNLARTVERCRVCNKKLQSANKSNLCKKCKNKQNLENRKKYHNKVLGVPIKNKYINTKSGYINLYLQNGVVIEEHRYIMIQHLKRELAYNETVHHINENKKDNKLENLELKHRIEHAKQHSKKVPKAIILCAHCGKTFEKLRSQYKAQQKRGVKNFYCSRYCSFKGFSKRS